MHQRHDFNESLGKLISWEKTPNGLMAKLKNAYLAVTIYDESIIRIQISRFPITVCHSYAVVRPPILEDFVIEENEQFLNIETNLIQLQIDRSPVRLSFYDKSGKLLNADDPAFGTSWIGTEVTTYKSLQEGERFIGLGEKTGNVDRRGEAYENWNTDYFAYPTNGDPLYLTAPFYIGVHSELAYGIFFDNTYRTRFNFGASNNRFSYFSAEDGDMDYYFIHDQGVSDIIQAYTWLTGRMELPPKWSLGLQQCRYSYYPDKEVIRIAETFREKEIPADVIYLDIHYMDAYKAFSWDGKRFPDPKSMIDHLKSIGFHVAIIVDPGIKKENGYHPHDSGVEADVFVKYPDKSYYTGNVWPGECYFPDFTNKKTRQWWGQLFANYVNDGLEGFWNDMNEPASWGQCTPNLIEFDYDGEQASHRKARNVYGMQMARSTQEGVKELMGEKRPFILTRSGYSGIQRYAAVWTGDNVAEDDHMLLGTRLVNSLGLTGVAYSGYDVGGFCGEASSNLFARWISIGAFSPFFRCHSMINSHSAEPWTFGEEVTEIARNYVNLRYRLLPYLYSHFYLSHLTGLPISRSLAIDYTHDPQIYDPAFQNQYFFGDALMVVPLPADQSIAKVYLPKGIWYDFYTDRYYKGGQHIFVEAPPRRLPLFVRGSAIIPMQSLVQHVEESPTDILDIHWYAGDTDHTFLYYEDDGKTYTFQKGDYFRRDIYYIANDSRLLISPNEGNRASHFKTVRIYLHGFGRQPGVKVNGHNTSVKITSYRFVNPIANFDPFESFGTFEDQITYLPYIEIEWQEGKIELEIL